MAIIGGHLMMSPDSENSGFNSSSLFKSKEVKVEANKYAGKIMLKGGSIAILLGLVLNLLLSVDDFKSDKLKGINIFALIISSYVIVITVLVLTEDYLKKTFDKAGNRKEKK